jgi:SOS response regulatory protein OraA/RecX
LGYFGIKKKFLLKKLPSDLIEKVLEEGLSKEDELKIARRYCSSLSRTKTNLASRPGSKTKFVDESSDITYNTYDEELTKQKQKLFAKLKSRGFRGDVIAKLIL